MVACRCAVWSGLPLRVSISRGVLAGRMRLPLPQTCEGQHFHGLEHLVPWRGRYRGAVAVHEVGCALGHCCVEQRTAGRPPRILQAHVAILVVADRCPRILGGTHHLSAKQSARPAADDNLLQRVGEHDVRRLVRWQRPPRACRRRPREVRIPVVTMAMLPRLGTA